MRDELRDWAESHGETRADYYTAEDEDRRREALAELSVNQLIEYYEQDHRIIEHVTGLEGDDLKAAIMDAIIEQNLDKE